MTNQKEKDNAKENSRKNILKRLLQVTISVLVVAIILFTSAGRIDWIYAWTFIGSSILIIIINAFLFPPELIAERGQKKENVEKWDKIISGFIIIPWLGIYLVSGLDIRFEWSSEIPIWIHILGLFAFIFGNVLVSWAMTSNKYFSTAVRIQYERGHTVVDKGTYKYIRHPGYLGMIIYHLSTPLILGSFWALLPATLVVILFIVRTAFEDNTLKNKLEGYKDYVERVKHRLIPGVW